MFYKNHFILPIEEVYKGCEFVDDVIVRRRLPRHNIPAKRKRKNTGQTVSLFERVVRQTLISIIILISLGIIKSVNSPVTNYLSDKAKTIIFQNIELKSLYEGIDKAFNKLWNENAQVKDEKSFDQQAVPAANISGTDGINKTSDDNNANTIIDTEQPTKDKLDNSLSGDTVGSENNKNTVEQKYHFVIPVEGVLGSPFGERVHPIKKDVEFHKGIDIEANKGVPIKAALAGDVIESGTESTLGKYLKLKHQDGIITVYAHCSALLTGKGKKVKQGEVIAKVGDTGESVGPHLHFEIWMDGNAVNPLDYVKVPAK